MIAHKITRKSAWISSSASMASSFGSNLIDLSTFVGGEIAAWSPGRYGVPSKGSGPNANACQLGKASLRLLRLGLQVRDFSFDGCIQARSRLPIWIKVPDLSQRILRLRLCNSQPCCLSRRWIKPITIDEDRSAAAAPCVLCVLLTWYPRIVGRHVRDDPRIIGRPVSAVTRPLPTVRIAGRHARLVG